MSVREGEIFVIVGLSGSGKSTLIRCINRLIPATEGQILVDGQDVMSLTESQLQQFRRTKAAMVFQRFSLFPHKSVIDNVDYGLKIQGIPLRERRCQAMKVLETVGLDQWANAFPSELSGGMQQRVGLARALATDPAILLMDEAFGALDPLIKGEMQDELLRLHGKLKKTIVFITHDIQEAIKLGDQIAVMRNGAFVQVGTAEELLTHPADDYVKTFMKDINRVQILRLESLPLQHVPAVVADKSIGAALNCLHQYQCKCLCVVDNTSRPLGVVTESLLLRAATQGNGNEQQINQLKLTEATQAQVSTKIIDLIPDLHPGLPVTVLDLDGHYLGFVDPVTMLKTACRRESATSDDIRLTMIS